jgi:iron complex outermembrane receptor protein
VDRALRTPGRLDRDAATTVYAGTSGGRPLYVQLIGNDNYQPEVLIGWNVGFRQLLWQKVFVDIAAFHNQYDGLQGFGGPDKQMTLQTNPYPYYLISEGYTNALRGVSDGLEIAPDWKPNSWLQLRGNFSHVHVNLHSRPGYAQSSASLDQASPHRTASAQAVLTLPHGWELVPDYRSVSRLPAENVAAYQTADLRIAYRVKQHLEASATGRNLLQPHHQEFLGNDNNAVGIKREVYGGLEWLW